MMIIADEVLAREYAEGKEQATKREWSAYGDIRMQAFLDGLRAQRARDAKIAWAAVRNAAERMDDANGCALMADIAESAIQAGGSK